MSTVDKVDEELVPMMSVAPTAARVLRGPCKFFSTPGGCRDGNMCRFQHRTGDTAAKIRSEVSDLIKGLELGGGIRCSTCGTSDSSMFGTNQKGRHTKGETARCKSCVATGGSGSSVGGGGSSGSSGDLGDGGDGGGTWLGDGEDDPPRSRFRSRSRSRSPKSRGGRIRREVKVPNWFAPALIGPKGANHKQFQKCTGCSMRVDEAVSVDSMRTVELEGSTEDVEAGKALVQDLLSQRRTLQEKYGNRRLPPMTIRWPPPTTATAGTTAAAIAPTPAPAPASAPALAAAAAQAQRPQLTHHRAQWSPRNSAWQAQRSCWPGC